MTYFVLSFAFLGAAALVAAAAVAIQRRDGGTVPLAWTSIVAAAIALFVLTTVFDNLMIAVGLFSYAEEQISGLRLGLAPVEDFSYPLAAVILLPGLWVLTGRFSARRRPDAD